MAKGDNQDPNSGTVSGTGPAGGSYSIRPNRAPQINTQEAQNNYYRNQGGYWGGGNQQPRTGINYTSSTGNGNLSAGTQTSQWAAQPQINNGSQLGVGGPNPNWNGGWWRQGNQQQYNPNNTLFQGMDPRLVALFQRYNRTPTGSGTGNNDIAYWNAKLLEPGADQNYYINRLESDFQGNGPDMNNDHGPTGVGPSGSANQGMPGRYYQQPMPRYRGMMRNRMQRGNRRGYQADNRSPWGYQAPVPNTNVIPQPTPKPDTSEQ